MGAGEPELVSPALSVTCDNVFSFSGHRCPRQ